ncbi:hypothetical protein [Actinokineospora terrae]|uniref:Uncharacterized protein n=1 Tax=Actinokineospora terrae TaxID=155974 RepID=A0A1H9XPI9_9PSEU|nr:hypothetical protein [Actinokineospora terrae]SES47929.1 hypothetical protein SAMN04487818_11839 [Actinokineospora terrae]
MGWVLGIIAAILLCTSLILTIVGGADPTWRSWTGGIALLMTGWAIVGNKGDTTRQK